LPVAPQVIRGQACLTGRGDHQHHPMPLRGEFGHRARREQGLIVGMGVEEDDGS
jgi:hypothetical protein